MRMLWHTLESGNCPQLRCLNVSGITFKTPVAVSMATTIRSGAMKGMEELDMDDCSLSTECIEHMCRAISDCPLQVLKRLSLAKNRLSQQSLQILCHIFQKDTLPSLTYLNLSCNKINDEGVQELNNRYRDDVLTQVETLDLSENCIGNEGAFVIFDNIRHRQWKCLHDLNLQRNKFTAVTGVQLRSLLEMDNELDTIHLTDMTKRRSSVPLYRRESRMDETHRRSKETKHSEEKLDLEPFLEKEKQDVEAAAMPAQEQVKTDVQLSPTACVVCWLIVHCVFTDAHRSMRRIDPLHSILYNKHLSQHKNSQYTYSSPVPHSEYSTHPSPCTSSRSLGTATHTRPSSSPPPPSPSSSTPS